MTDIGMKYLSIALALLPLTAVALALGRIFADWISSVARNPASRGAVQQIGLLGMALTEAVALFALVVVFIVLFVA
jgi:F0F1-type ATP synthase membrane subunit c/vacuolar-type H+-ATPase subunit K